MITSHNLALPVLLLTFLLLYTSASMMRFFFKFSFFFPCIVNFLRLQPKKLMLAFMNDWYQDPSCRESDYRTYWLARNHRILDWLLNEKSSIICLQVCMYALWLSIFIVHYICIVCNVTSITTSAMRRKVSWKFICGERLIIICWVCAGVLGWKWRAC